MPSLMSASTLLFTLHSLYVFLWLNNPSFIQNSFIIEDVPNQSEKIQLDCLTFYKVL